MTRPVGSAISTASPGGSAATGGSITSLANTQGCPGRTRARTRNMGPPYPGAVDHTDMNDLVDGWYRAVLNRPSAPAWTRRGLKTIGILVRELTRDQVHVRAATLAYWSLVAIVPALVLAASLMKPMGIVGVDPLREMFYSALLA